MPNKLYITSIAGGFCVDLEMNGVIIPGLKKTIPCTASPKVVQSNASCATTGGQLYHIEYDTGITASVADNCFILDGTPVLPTDVLTFLDGICPIDPESKKEITQTGHGFTNTNPYTPAFINSAGLVEVADSSDDQTEAFGLVEVIDANTLNYIVNDGIYEATGHGFPLGSILYLQPNGGLAITPSDCGIQKIYEVIDANCVQFLKQPMFFGKVKGGVNGLTGNSTFIFGATSTKTGTGVYDIVYDKECLDNYYVAIFNVDGGNTFTTTQTTTGFTINILDSSGNPVDGSFNFEINKCDA